MEFLDSEIVRRLIYFLRIRNVDIVLLQRSVTWFLLGKWKYRRKNRSGSSEVSRNGKNVL